MEEPAAYVAIGTASPTPAPRHSIQQQVLMTAVSQLDAEPEGEVDANTYLVHPGAQPPLSRRVRRLCGCDVISMRAKAQYVLKATSWISILLAFRYPFLGTIIYALLRRLFIAMPMFMMWFTNTLLSVSMLWLPGDAKPVVAILGIMQGLVCAVVDLVIASLFPILQASMFEEPDGTVNIDWAWLHSFLNVLGNASTLSALVYLTMSAAGLVFLCAHRVEWCLISHTTAAEDLKNQALTRVLEMDTPWFSDRTSRCFVSPAIRSFVSRHFLWIPAITALCFSFGGLVDYVAVTGSSCGPNSMSCHSNCDPLDTTACALPFPSSFYLNVDNTTLTGYRLAFTPESLPGVRSSGYIDPMYLNEADGFSTIAPLLFYIDGSTMDGIPNTHSNISAYTSSLVKTVIVNADTNETHPHWVEIDIYSGNGSDPVFILQPARPFNHSCRYVVGVRNLVNSSGIVLPPTRGFAALRNAPDTNSRARHFRSVVFPALLEAGFATEDLQLAWDFVTVSRSNSLGRVESARDVALAALPAGGPAYTISRVDQESCASATNVEPGTPRVVWGYMTVPFFLAENRRGQMFPRPGGNPRPANMSITSTFQAGFVFVIPCSLLVQGSPQASTFVQYGHGLLGTRGEATDDYLGLLAHVNKWVVGATDWYGMSQFDLLNVFKVLVATPSKFASIPESTGQGYVNQAVLLRLALGDFSSTCAHMLNFGGAPILTPSTPVAFYGISQGAVIGGGYFGMSQQLTRAVFGVPGTPFALLLSRSLDFESYQALLEFCFHSALDIRIVLTLLQQQWDAGESAGWLSTIAFPPAGYPSKSILIQAAYGDAQVTTLGAELMSRSYGAAAIAPPMHEVFGVPDMTAPFGGSGVSAFVEWNYTFVVEVPFGDIPASGDTDTHECVRKEPAAMQQVSTFIADGVFNQYCPSGSPCVAARCCAHRDAPNWRNPSLFPTAVCVPMSRLGSIAAQCECNCKNTDQSISSKTTDASCNCPSAHAGLSPSLWASPHRSYRRSLVHSANDLLLEARGGTGSGNERSRSVKSSSSASVPSSPVSDEGSLVESGRRTVDSPPRATEAPSLLSTVPSTLHARTLEVLAQADALARSRFTSAVSLPAQTVPPPPVSSTATTTAVDINRPSSSERGGMQPNTLTVHTHQQQRGDVTVTVSLGGPPPSRTTDELHTRTPASGALRYRRSASGPASRRSAGLPQHQSSTSQLSSPAKVKRATLPTRPRASTGNSEVVGVAPARAPGAKHRDSTASSLDTTPAAASDAVGKQRQDGTVPTRKPAAPPPPPAPEPCLMCTQREKRLQSARAALVQQKSRFEKERDGLVRMYEGRLLTESTVAEATITRLRSNVDDIDAANARAVATLKANFDQQLSAVTAQLHEEQERSQALRQQVSSLTSRISELEALPRQSDANKVSTADHERVLKHLVDAEQARARTESANAALNDKLVLLRKEAQHNADKLAELTAALTAERGACVEALSRLDSIANEVRAKDVSAASDRAEAQAKIVTLEAQVAKLRGALAAAATAGGGSSSKDKLIDKVAEKVVVKPPVPVQARRRGVRAVSSNPTPKPTQSAHGKRKSGCGKPRACASVISSVASEEAGEEDSTVSELQGRLLAALQAHDAAVLGSGAAHTHYWEEQSDILLRCAAVPCGGRKDAVPR